MVDAAIDRATDTAIRTLSPSDLPVVTREAALLSQLLVDPRLALWFAEIYGVRVRMVRDSFLSGALLKLQLRCAGGTLVICFPADSMPALALAVHVEGALRPSVATLVAASLLSHLLEEFGNAAEMAGDERWQDIVVLMIDLVTPTDAIGYVSPIVAFDITLKNNTYTRLSVMSVDPGCVESLRQLVDKMPVIQHAGMRDWRVTGIFRLASRRWLVSILQSLEIGDVLVCIEGASIDVLRAEFICGALSGLHWIATVDINQQKVTMKSEIETYPSSADSELDSAMPPLASSIAELEVPVHFEIDSAALSLSQLATLRPGYVIELSIPISQVNINVVACGQLLGTGRLVAVGDSLGVQLEHLASVSR